MSMLPETERAISRIPDVVSGLRGDLKALEVKVDLLVSVMFAHVVHETQIPADEMAPLVVKARARLDGLCKEFEKEVAKE